MGKKMSGQGLDLEKRLEAAELRLANAIGQLEAALDGQGSATTAVDPALADEISRLQNENVELKSLVGQTSHRLDSTIVKLKDHMQSQSEGQA